jgi:hypothetical protein
LRSFARIAPEQGPRNGWLDELALAIGDVEPPQARPAFRSALRQRLLATAAAQPPRKPAVGPFVFFSPRLAPVRVLAAGLVVSVALGAGGGVAAASSLPGEPAYTLKQVLERVELTLTFDPATRTEVLAAHADRRLSELARVTVARRDLRATATAEYEAAVDSLRLAVEVLVAADADEKADRALDVAAAASAKHLKVLEQLASREPRENELKADLLEAMREARGLGQSAEQHKKDRDEKKEQNDREPGRPDFVDPPGRPTSPNGRDRR